VQLVTRRDRGERHDDAAGAVTPLQSRRRAGPGAGRKRRPVRLAVVDDRERAKRGDRTRLDSPRVIEPFRCAVQRKHVAAKPCAAPT